MEHLMENSLKMKLHDNKVKHKTQNVIVIYMHGANLTILGVPSIFSHLNPVFINHIHFLIVTIIIQCHPLVLGKAIEGDVQLTQLKWC